MKVKVSAEANGNFQFLAPKYHNSAIINMMIGQGVLSKSFSIHIKNHSKGSKKFSMDSP